MPELLSKRGTFYMVAVSQNDVPDLIGTLRSHGLAARVALMRAADAERLHIISASWPQAEAELQSNIAV